MMSTAASEIAASWQTGKHFRRVRGAARGIVLAISDASAFLIVDLLLRQTHSVPTLIFSQSSNVQSGARTVDVYFILACLFIVVRFIAGDYSRRLLFWDEARQTTKSLIVASVPDIILLAAAPMIYSPFAIICSWLLLIVALPACRQIARSLLSAMDMWRIPSVLIGDGNRTQEIRHALSGSLSLGFRLRAIIDFEPAQQHSLPQPSIDRGTVADVQEAVRRAIQSGCEQAVIAVDDMHSGRFADLVQAFLETDITVAVVPSLKRLPVTSLTTSHFFGKDILLLQVRDNSRQWSKRVIKRAFDIAGSAALLTLLAPIFVAIAIAIKWHDRGPIFYAHKRVGRGGAGFGCLKFRSMAIDADARLAQWKEENPELYAEFLKTFKLKNDPRVTRPGGWLRRTSLDELPQLFNVLRGDMSLVGPRPVVARELEEYYGSAAQLYCRVRPGMTGLWQVSGRSETSYDERVTFDEWYVLNWNFWYDLVILIQTAWIVTHGRGAF